MGDWADDVAARYFQAIVWSNRLASELRRAERRGIERAAKVAADRKTYWLDMADKQAANTKIRDQAATAARCRQYATGCGEVAELIALLESGEGRKG